MNFLRLLTISFVILLILGCAEKKPEILKEFYAEDVHDFIKKMQNYQSIESSLAIDYESKGNLLSGDALLKINKNETLLRIYYIGFPAGEVYQKDEEVSSTLPIEKDKVKQILTGVRKGFMWWVGDFEINEKDNNFILKEKNSDREVMLNKKGFIPVSQSFTFENQQILITYDNFKEFQTEDKTSLVMPSRIIVYYKNRTLTINIEKLKLING
ncbi:hypothetical protein V4D30_09685 [Thermodesulfovibrio sp. 3907-1M]|uniref:DUF4292 domain-containing protein n=1 Tax=Thermodesulfovibrio autotrophicus TaxID=3118333 RepID=A0AAU8GW78_9BACT